MRQIKVAFLDLEDSDQRPLKSALGVCTRALDTQFEWTAPHSADICIVNVHGRSPKPDNAVLVRFSSHKNGVPVDLARPVHTRVMIDVFSKAIKDVAKKAPSYQRSGVTVKRYRGAIVE
ncbi:hypothetical protein ATO7_12373 [Oceanococcus atlanticus]|uniref:Uncharacterized protein n=1 Tax=Oceanococcus atlanticus TaxID=1317117 RepID=A0A1Y1SBS2_9GAMM|nr:hypothetical protein [Oceanococcus atlanticus]ORE86090.1 hypothetical protein ATO7_12373 [Oceanococcus atlanticus]RZO86100.1 MAG: hypothetical protein EVA65_03970 [Oceanococcus sp.]